MKLFGAGFIAVVLVQLTLLAGVIFVAVHFISKYW